MSQPALRIVEGTSMDKSKALSAALSQIERQFGKGSVMRLGKNDKAMEIESVSTGSLGLDHAGAALRRRGPEEGRHLRLHRCRACARPGLCPQARGQCRRSPDLAA